MAYVHHQSFYASELLKCGCSFMYRHNEISSNIYCINFLHMRYVPVCVVGDRLFYGRGTKCVFLGFCCVDATLMMGVMGWGGGDGNVP